MSDTELATANGTIPWPADHALYLYVKDEWVPDGFVVYLNGREVDRQHTMDLFRYPLPPVGQPLAVQVEFAGPDGGRAALVAIPDGDGPRVVLGESEGLSHTFTVGPGA